MTDTKLDILSLMTQWNLRTIMPMKLIAEGSFGKVGAARHKITRETAALKIIHKETNDPKVMDLQKKVVKTELEVWNIINGHEFILDFKGYFEGRKKYYFVSELARSGSLYDLLTKTGPLQLDQIRIIVAQIASAIHFMHSKKILHRDLKPANVLIGNDKRVKLTDFGLSKLGLRSKSLVGTPEYMAPEVYAEKGYGPACDWFSLGIMTFEMVLGHTPWCHIFSLSPKDYEKLTTYFRVQTIKRTLLDPVFTDMCTSYDDDECLTNDVATLVKNLTAKKIRKRLGHCHKNALKDLHSQAFFEGHDWDGLMKHTIPGCLNVSHSMDS